jgi:hypothetical protein
VPQNFEIAQKKGMSGCWLIENLQVSKSGNQHLKLQVLYSPLDIFQKLLYLHNLKEINQIAKVTEIVQV